MRWLYRIDPIGEGSSDVEGLPSLLLRCAQRHGISSRHLISMLVQRSSDPTAHSEGAVANAGLAQFVRPNGTTQFVLELFAEATGSEPNRVHSTTFMALHDALDRSRQAYAKIFRWCPTCMAEMLQWDQEPYFKLLWHLNDVTDCPIHHVPLIDRCPNCNTTQRFMGLPNRMGHCMRCDATLAESTGPERRTPDWKFDAQDLVELVGDIAQHPGLTYPLGSVRECMKSLLDLAWENEQELELWNCIPRDEYLSYTECDAPLTLLTARKLAYRLDMRLITLLEGKVEHTNRALAPSWSRDLPPRLRPKPRKSPIDRNKLWHKIDSVLKDSTNGAAPSLNTVAQSAGISKGGLIYHFPERARQIVAAHEGWRQEQNEGKKLLARSETLKLLTDPQGAPNQCFSRKHALRLLREKTGLPKNLLRREIALVMDA